jgi:thioredoxin:protein disulfide reductase
MGMLSALAIGPCVTAPLAGAWMVMVKFFFGIGLLAVANWLLGRILPAYVTLALWLLLAISPVLFLITKRRWQPASLLAFTYGLILWLGFSSNQLGSISPLLCSVSVACEQKPQLAFKKIETLEELHQHLANARTNKQWIMLDYYADWCVACSEMANDTFSDQKVLSALSQTILLQADVTNNSPADQALLKQFKLMGPPAVLFFGPDQLERVDYRVMGVMKADEFMGILNQLWHAPLS